MQSGSQESFLNLSQRSIVILFLTLIICSVLVFKNIISHPIFLLKKFGDLSIDPEIAFTNNKPTFLEFYAEWCEVCKEMAPRVNEIKNEYEEDINFVFLNVDNPKWDIYIRKFNVNGIPQVNLFDTKANLGDTFIGKQEETIIKTSLENLKQNLQSQTQFSSTDLSSIKRNKNLKSSPRSHG